MVFCCVQHVDIEWDKVVSSAHLLFNVYDVLDGSVLRCTGCGIASVSLFVSNMLSLDASKMFPACICFFNFYNVGDEFLLLCSDSGIASVPSIVSNTLTLDRSKLFSMRICC